jgi:hypothetical protein
MVTLLMLPIVVVMLRFSVEAHGYHAGDVFRMLTIIMLALVAVCIYQYIQTLSSKG